MPEGHTLHRLARDHTRLFKGHVVSAASPQGRFAEGAALLDGQVLARAEAHGKHLFHRYANGVWLHVHLGLYGKWPHHALPAPEPRGMLRLRLATEEVYADLRGPTACEILTPAERTAILARLGPDPLTVRPDPQPFFDRVARSRQAVGQLLMDQAVVAGIGNVYRAEVLFRAELSPFVPGREVPTLVLEQLWADLVDLMKAGLRAGRIVTTEPYDRERPAGRARREDSHYVYRRAGLPCRRCFTPVATQVMAARNLFWCPTCQAGVR